MSWPRGKYNGRRIDGFAIGLHLRLLWWPLIPRFRWNFGEPYAYWLCFTIRAKAIYEN